MNQFVQRVANYIANEVLIKGLANSKTFQRFALRTDHSLQQVKKQGTESFEEMTKRAASTVTDGSSSGAAMGTPGGPPAPPLRGFPGFIRAFFKEVQRDLGGGGK
ncbi:expressed unknown protein [Seminavis robusta]|uniref:Uncharacterized protein n=1 Tax=Seminavis robusta TaxID=568900 RepID=A0A9N8E573_9STRA|nr:expressed unknown protein [Seminavis robusta]|eukprot:Sro554_g165540.1 n/a (105) ;mRNA; r:37286-37600